MSTTAWFSRKFETSYPLELLPNVEARLRGTAARLDELMRGCPREVLIAKPEGKWSAQEHAGHMLELEALWFARVQDFAAGSGQLTPADLKNRSTDAADYNSRSLDEVLAAFRSARTSLLHAVRSVPASAHAGTIPHPRLRTPMRLIDHLYFAAEHDDHHLARIWELISPGE